MTRGRVKRKASLAVLADAVAEPGPECCGLCGRPLGRRVERHHVVPKSRGGRVMVALHPICYRMIHAAVANADLARDHPDLDSLRARGDVARFLAWIGGKPPDFHAPTLARADRVPPGSHGTR